MEKINGRRPTPENFYETFYKKTDFWKGQDSCQLFCATGQTQFDNGIHALNGHNYLLAPLASIQLLVAEFAKYIPELNGNRLMCEFLKEDYRLFEWVSNRYPA